MHPEEKPSSPPPNSPLGGASRSSITLSKASNLAGAPTVPIRPPAPSLKLLFSFLSHRQCFQFLAPALAASIVAGGIAPFMTFLVGQVFDTFAKYPIDQPSPQDRHNLLRDIGVSCLQLVGLGVASFILSGITSCLWIWTGERNVGELRKHVYISMSHKDMEWFDSRTEETAEDNVPIGAAGLMAKFARETSEIRTASSLASGMLVQYLTTCVTCLVLAFQRSWALTLVILSAVPLLFIIQALSQIFAGPLVEVDRKHSARAATLIEHVITAISTVKAFNAAAFELRRLSETLDRLVSTTFKLNGVWGLTSGLSQFTMMAMFVQGFWFGSKLVKDGHINAGDVMAVFWACLIATSNFQMCIPQLITLNKGKFAIASILSLVGPPSNSPAKQRRLRKVLPDRCIGELSVENVTFAYPSRPTVPVLQDVSIFIPAQEMTFIVGGSGSGKSTLAQLLLHLYEPTSGQILFEDNSLHMLDDEWTRTHIASVSQDCILFDMSVHDNVAMGLVGSGRQPKDASRDEVVVACTAALMHEFIRDLPDGYDTLLGPNGSNLSGGQRQRLAIARAQLRNPTVLILDEATSALDPTSRVLVFEAIKHWRQDKTTVVITHDLSQVTADDFVYVLKDGTLAEQGYRSDLEVTDGEFHRMLMAQVENGGCLPSKDIDTQEEVPVFNEQEQSKSLSAVQPQVPFLDASVAEGPARPGTWMLEVITDLTGPSKVTLPVTRAPPVEQRRTRPISVQISDLSLTLDTIPVSRRYSLPFTPTSTAFSFDDKIPFPLSHQPSVELSPPRRKGSHTRIRWESQNEIPLVPVETAKGPNSSPVETSYEPDLAIFRTILKVFRQAPHKFLLAAGLATCVFSGAMTPVFSFLLSRLMFEVSIGAYNAHIINVYGGIVLIVAAFDGIFLGFKFFIMENVAMSWITSVRNQALTRILAQDKEWFDQSSNAAVHVVHKLIQDGDEARVLLALVVGQFLVVVTMLGVGLVWAMVQGWQLTLVGFAIAPFFAVTMAIQAKLVSRVEFQNKQARERVAQCYYETISNIRAIRSMSFEPVFKEKFEEAVKMAMVTGNKGGKLEGISFGFASGLIYLSEAILFYVGAVLIARGTYTYLQMVETLNLLLFTVTIGSQLLAFTQKIARSVQGTQSIQRLLDLPEKGKESHGVLRPTNMSNVVFHDVHFQYPSRPDVPVLTGVNLDVCDECVAVVGASGSGKSTIASLLQRFYEANQGIISVGANDVRSIEVAHLRNAIGVVSQNPYLFDATVRDNIAYGDESLTDEDVERAAKAARVHDFIQQLPNGYLTHVGENASLISGGQAQRIAIARALARTCSILILDECTSALDATNQRAILETIRSLASGRTTFMITHKLPVMQMCDRIFVLENGRIVEQGSYDTLMRQHGVFAALANAGEWSG